MNINEASKEPMKVFLETFGCQMNILDSELIQGQLSQAGHSFVSNPKEANVVLLNTCSVRDLSEHKVLSRLGILKERKNNTYIHVQHHLKKRIAIVETSLLFLDLFI